MGLTNAAGTAITRAAFPSTAVADTDPKRTVTSAVYESYHQPGETSEVGTGRRLKFRAGQVVRTSDIDAAFAPATAALSPGTGPAAGGTVVTLTGTNLDGVTAVTFGGTPGTALTVTGSRTVTVTSPAKAAGTYAVLATDDSGPVAAGNFIYT